MNHTDSKGRTRPIETLGTVHLMKLASSLRSWVSRHPDNVAGFEQTVKKYAACLAEIDARGARAVYDSVYREIPRILEEK